MKIRHRRPYKDEQPEGYRESDRDYLENNLQAAVILLDRELSIDKRNIAIFYEKAEILALIEVEGLARTILREHPHLNEFVMAMGTAFFTTKKDDQIIRTDERKYTEPIYKFLVKWDNIFKLTGNPMRFTANGKKITN